MVDHLVNDLVVERTKLFPTVNPVKQIVANGVNALREKNNSFLIITHYQRLLEYIKPDFVHVLIDGKIKKSGGPELALELESKGYENFN